MASANRTPLRRVSQGSLSTLARSQSASTGSTGLEFLSPAMTELAEEMEMMIANLDGLNQMADSLDSFNEAFASYLFVMKMNTLCVEWPEAPTASSFLHRVEELERELAIKSSSIQQSLVTPSSPNYSHARVGEISYAVPSAPPPSSPSPPPIPSSKTAPSTTSATQPSSRTVPTFTTKKPQLTAKEKKLRSIWIEKLINMAPVDFRGNNPTLRKAAEEVLSGLIDSGKPIRPSDLVKPNILPPVMVNKCLIALVAAKIVQKETINGAALYQLSELGYKAQPE